MAYDRLIIGEHVAGASLALLGGDWDASLADFHQRRDALLMPAYQGTVNYTRGPEALPESVAWLRSVFSSPGMARTIAYALPALIASSETVPPPMVTRLGAMASRFAELRVAAPVG